MDFKTQDLYNKSTEYLINAMEQYIKFIEINSSLRNLDIQFHYLKSLPHNNMMTKYEIIDKQCKRQNLLNEKEMVRQNIISQSYNSIMLALTLIDTSLVECDRFGLEMSKALIQSILKFIIDGRPNISIPKDALMPQVMKIYAKLVNNQFNSYIELTDYLNQLMSL
ncbi:MAG: hypothetical protein HDR74_08655 [Bacteroides sp.]|nr:hypothetical protein [Bacteroides sp.]